MEIDIAFVSETRIHGDAYDVDEIHSVEEEELGEELSENTEVSEEKLEVRNTDLISVE